MRARVMESWVVSWVRGGAICGGEGCQGGATVCSLWTSLLVQWGHEWGRGYRHLLDTWLLEIAVVP